jgi:hypothetical protein
MDEVGRRASSPTIVNGCLVAALRLAALTGALGMAIAHDVRTVDELVKRRDAVVAMLEDVIESAWQAKAKGSGQH